MQRGLWDLIGGNSFRLAGGSPHLVKIQRRRLASVVIVAVHVQYLHLQTDCA